MADTRPTLVYDGDCGICRYWVDYWRGLTGERVVYRPYQEAAADFPAIPPAAFRHAIQFIEPDGQVHSGAAATFRVLREVPGRGRVVVALRARAGLRAGKRMRVCVLRAPARPAQWRLEGPLGSGARGGALRPGVLGVPAPVRRDLPRRIRVARRADPGARRAHAGILPLADYLDAAHRALGGAAYRILPTLFWLDASDTALIAGTVVGAVLGLLVILDWWTRPALIGLFALYLSYVYAGQDFMSFQWDALLLEAGFLAMFLTGGSRIVVWLYRWLVFRYLLLAGAVKLLSGDATWRALTALDYHFWTQPLPIPARLVRRATAPLAAGRRHRRDARGGARWSYSWSSCRGARGPSRRAACCCSRR